MVPNGSDEANALRGWGLGNSYFNSMEMENLGGLTATPTPLKHAAESFLFIFDVIAFAFSFIIFITAVVWYGKILGDR